jgi:hypothetical protein
MRLTRQMQETALIRNGRCSMCETGFGKDRLASRQRRAIERFYTGARIHVDPEVVIQESSDSIHPRTMHVTTLTRHTIRAPAATTTGSLTCTYMSTALPPCDTRALLSRIRTSKYPHRLSTPTCRDMHLANHMLTGLPVPPSLNPRPSRTTAPRANHSHCAALAHEKF